MWNNLTDSNTNETDSGQVEEDNSGVRLANFICAILIMAISCLGVMGNSISLAVFPKMKGSINILLAGLSLADMFVALLGAPVFSVLGVFSYFRVGESLFSYLTKFIYPLAMMAQTASIWILIVITVERFIAVYFPLQAKFICTPTVTTVALALTIWTAVMYNFVRFWEYELAWDESTGTSYLEELLRADEEYLRVYVVWMYLITQFILPFGCLVTLNGLIVVKIRAAKVYRETLSRQQTKEYKTANMMVIVIIIFILCNTLAFCLNVLETAQNGRLKKESWFFLCTDVNNLLVECNSACNCLVYYQYSLMYRRAVKKCLTRSGSHDIAYHSVAMAQVSNSNCCD